MNVMILRLYSVANVIGRFGATRLLLLRDVGEFMQMHMHITSIQYQTTGEGIPLAGIIILFESVDLFQFILRIVHVRSVNAFLLGPKLVLFFHCDGIWLGFVFV